MSYLHATIPSDVDTELSRVYQPAEPVAFTLARAIVAHLLSTVWVPAVGLETNGRTATVQITIAAVGSGSASGCRGGLRSSRSPSTVAAILEPVAVRLHRR